MSEIADIQLDGDTAYLVFDGTLVSITLPQLQALFLDPNRLIRPADSFFDTGAAVINTGTEVSHVAIIGNDVFVGGFNPSGLRRVTSTGVETINGFRTSALAQGPQGTLVQRVLG